jgi:hypothetical protein
MKLQNFLNLVPRGVKTAAMILLVLTAALGTTASCMFPIFDLHGHPVCRVGGIVLGFLGGTLTGCLCAVWLLCVGYVYADSRRRGMMPVLWVLVVVLFPNLLGFLLYFVMRQPLGVACPHCGQPVALYQRFCSWCGQPQPTAPPAGAPSFPGAGNSPAPPAA